uniref:Uncharacterized protein n=1 Tax=Anguilla anguilla TaxID=7936 RepID=A0A0E9WPX3_ANGAN
MYISGIFQQFDYYTTICLVNWSYGPYMDKIYLHLAGDWELVSDPIKHTILRANTAENYTALCYLHLKTAHLMITQDYCACAHDFCTYKPQDWDGRYTICQVRGRPHTYTAPQVCTF